MCFCSLAHKRSAIVLALLVYMSAAFAQAPAEREDYLNPVLPVEQRVDDLVRRMTLAEKISQMQNKSPSIPRLHISEYD